MFLLFILQKVNTLSTRNITTESLHTYMPHVILYENKY